MLNLPQRIEAFSELGDWLRYTLDDHVKNGESELTPILKAAFIENGWFEEREVLHALNYWADALQAKKLETWLNDYPIQENAPNSVLLVLAGNIPMVGFHDVLSTIISGNKALIKCSSSDSVLIPILLGQLVKLKPHLSETYELREGITRDFDAVLATGSNNSSRHFEQYFEHVPSVIRKNRTGVAVLSGDEKEQELDGLMEDAFRYYGLGCRNITKLFLPTGFELNKIFAASLPFSYMMENKKYANNYMYHKSVMMLERKNVLENELILMHEEERLFSPVSVLHYVYYDDKSQLNALIDEQLDNIQCVIGKDNTGFGKAQSPRLNDYADGVDTLNFLVNLSAREASK